MQKQTKRNGDGVAPRVGDAFSAAAGYKQRFIGFLDPFEAAEAEKISRRLKAQDAYEDCSYAFYGGYSGAERVFLGVFPPYSEPENGEFPISAVNITWRFSELSHRDFLGAILALGIVRSKIGDILIGGGECTVFAERTVALFIAQNLKKVGNAGVRCEISSGDIVKREEHFKNIEKTVASSRLDCIVSALLGCSRSGASELITGGLVAVDFETGCDNTKEIDAGETVSIRGHGRFVIDKIGPPTKKGRLNLAARKYL